MTSRLPIAVAPAHHETAASYVTRLAHLHGIPFPELWQQVSRPRAASGAARFIAADRLAAVTGIPETRLARAVIEIRQPEPDWQAFRHEPQAGCPRCTARHPGGPVRQLFPHHRYVCTRHRIWIGPPDIIDQPYPALDELPEVVAAQRVHLRLLRRLGPAATYDAVLTGFLICGHRWDQDAHHPDDARLDWDERAAELIPQRMPELVTCRPQDLEALRLLRAAGWRIGIVTNGMTDNQHGKIHCAGLHALVDGWCISDEVGISKPEPAIFSIIAQRCGTSITRGGWMIGDDPILDVAGGRRAGLRTIWLQRESTLWPQDQPAPDNTVATVVDAVEILLHAPQPA